MNRNLKLICAFSLVILTAGPAMAVPVLFDWNFYVDGTTYEYLAGDSMPTTGSLNGNGLGSLSWSTSDIGDHTFIAMFDFEIDEELNGFYNEYGLASGALLTGQSWEIDEPGFVFGDIYDNLIGGALDNSNGVPAGAEDDVSFAMGWDFSLASDQTATIFLNLGLAAPSEGFYLEHRDPDSDQSIFLYSSLSIEGGGTVPVSEPATLLLLGAGLAGLCASGRKWRGLRKPRF